jgi:hypothetical protein
MGIPLSDDITRLIDGRNFAHLATVMSDGAPHSVPVWVRDFCQKYIGRAWPLRDAVAVALIIEVDKAHHEKLPFEHTLIEAAKRPA